ncbi:MAG: hypothetical protein HYV32_00685 [Candidatus Kerfeldbacteria bacterium]|nr:hypothetical protein [Candidatus Kerfeldbacteria bacterium]
MLKKLQQLKPRKKLDPKKPEERKKIIEKAVQRTVEEYGEALKKLSSE